MSELFIGVDYGAKQSFGVLMERHADGSWTLHRVVDGKGLDEVFPGTAPEQKSDGRSVDESDGGPESRSPGAR